MNRATNMPIHYQEQLLESLMHHLPMEVRHTVMREVPLAYNAYVGRMVMVVANASDDDRVGCSCGMADFGAAGHDGSER